MQRFTFLRASNISKNPTLLQTSTRGARYKVQRGDYMKASHEEAAKNPLIQKKNGNAFQHPCFCRGVCSVSNCVYKLCKSPCSEIIEHTKVGHATHNGTYKGTIFIANKDLNGKDRPQYAKMYEEPVPSSDNQGVEIDPKLTNGLKGNSQMEANVHMNSSKQPS